MLAPRGRLLRHHPEPRPPAARPGRDRAVLRAAGRPPAPVHAPIADRRCWASSASIRCRCAPPPDRPGCDGCCSARRSGDDAGADRPLRVLIDAGYAHRAPLSGTAVYVDALCAALAARDDVVPITVADRRRGAAGAGAVASAAPRRSGRLVGAGRPARARAPPPRRRDPSSAARPARAGGVRTGDHRARPRLCRRTRSGSRPPFGAGPVALTPRGGAPGRGGDLRQSRRPARDLRRSLARRRRASRRGRARTRAAAGAAGPRASRPSHFLYVGDDEPRKRLAAAA